MQADSTHIIRFREKPSPLRVALGCHVQSRGLRQDFKQIEASYGDDILHLVTAAGYLNKLMGNPAIGAYLMKHHGEIACEFRAIIAASSLDQSQTAVT
ncbi:plasmid partitioning protein RepB C-terminal domain-containing protein [Microvirga sp. P5_D2]